MVVRSRWFVIPENSYPFNTCPGKKSEWDESASLFYGVLGVYPLDIDFYGSLDGAFLIYSLQLYFIVSYRRFMNSGELVLDE
jgi:hypothetical protein